MKGGPDWVLQKPGNVRAFSNPSDGEEYIWEIDTCLFLVQIDTEITCQSELLQERGNICAFSEASYEDLGKKAPVASGADPRPGHRVYWYGQAEI